MKKIVVCLLTGMMLCLSACGKTESTSAQVLPQSVVDEVVTVTSNEEIQESTSQVSTEEECPPDCSEMINNEMGYSLWFSNYTASALASDGNKKETLPEFKDELDAAPYYVMLQNEKYELFTIYKLDQLYTDDELEEINPMMVHIGDSTTNSYAVLYVGEIPENLTQDEKDMIEAVENEVRDLAACIEIK